MKNDTERSLLPAASLDQGLGWLEGLLVLVSLLYWMAPSSPLAFPRTYAAITISLGLIMLLLRYRVFAASGGKQYVAARAAVMLIYITAVAAAAGGPPAALTGLYLLPVLVVALQLDRPALWIFLASILLARLLLAALAAGMAMPPVESMLAPVLETLPVLVLALLAAHLASANDTASRQLDEMARQDRLTGLHDQRSFQTLCAAEHQRASAGQLPYVVLKVDVDDLRVLNRELGEAAGDRILVTVADALKRSTRRQDLIARLGGDEFAILLPGATASEGEAVANRIRHNVWATHLDIGNRAHRVSVCVGQASYPEDGAEPRALLGLAEELMYREKRWRKRDPGAPAGTAS